MSSKLDQLRKMSTVVADTGDISQIAAYKPQDCTTNPTLILKAAQMPAHAALVEEALKWGRTQKAEINKITDRLAVNFGVELTKRVPGRVSTEVDADLSFDAAATIAKARELIADYEARGVSRARILIKIAATWEGAQAARVLQAEGIDCNLTLIFSMAQAQACADAGAYLISPFVGRILDWHVKNTGKTYTQETDPGVVSVKAIYHHFKIHGIKTIVMAASFRNVAEIEELAGCDRLTIAPQLLAELAEHDGVLLPQLVAEKASKAMPAPISESDFRWQMNENQMATEKLSEGIRFFARDLKSLREMVAQRL